MRSGCDKRDYFRKQTQTQYGATGPVTQQVWQPGNQSWPDFAKTYNASDKDYLCYGIS